MFATGLEEARSIIDEWGLVPYLVADTADGVRQMTNAKSLHWDNYFERRAREASCREERLDPLSHGR